MTIDATIIHLKKKYRYAIERTDIKKPITWALYQTWSWMDCYEEERKTEVLNKTIK